MWVETVFLVDFLKDNDCETQLLKATELGKPVYKKLGFKCILVYQRYDTEIGYKYKGSNSARKLKSSNLNYIYELKMHVYGENRDNLIDTFYMAGVALYMPLLFYVTNTRFS